MSEFTEKVCPQCSKKYPMEAAFCPDCGVALQDVTTSQQQDTPKKHFCPDCGTELPSDATFCPNCGYKKQASSQFDAEKWKKVIFEPNENENTQNVGKKPIDLDKVSAKADKATMFCLKAGIVVGVLMAIVGVIRAIADRWGLPLLGTVLALLMSLLSWLALRYFKKHNLNFNEIGRKIKKVAKILFFVTIWVCIIGAIASLVAAIIISITGSVLVGIALFVEALILLLLGPILAWLENCLLYGFGEIIDKLTDIEKNTRKE